MALQTCKWIRIADMSDRKSKDDGYRGVHVYFQLSSFHYPIEIQYNTYYDRQFSNWLLADFKERLVQAVGYEDIQLVTISRPSAYGVYEPYYFVVTEQEFEEMAIRMK